MGSPPWCAAAPRGSYVDVPVCSGRSCRRAPAGSTLQSRCYHTPGTLRPGSLEWRELKERIYDAIENLLLICWPFNDSIFLFVLYSEHLKFLALDSSAGAFLFFKLVRMRFGPERVQHGGCVKALCSRAAAMTPNPPVNAWAIKPHQLPKEFKKPHLHSWVKTLWLHCCMCPHSRYKYKILMSGAYWSVWVKPRFSQMYD